MQIQLTIVQTPDGQVQVSGPIGNKVLCYGLLELAKEVIREWSKEQSAKLVQPASSLSLVPPTLKQ